METSEAQKCDVAPATATAYLDPNYWSASQPQFWPSVCVFICAEMYVFFCLNELCWFRDKRFDHEEHYEWFKDYSHFRHLILEYIKPKSAVHPCFFLLITSLSVFIAFCVSDFLHGIICISALAYVVLSGGIWYIPVCGFVCKQVLEVGCGNSQLCEELYRDGITDLTCIDLSAVAVEKMKQRLSTKGYKGC